MKQKIKALSVYKKFQCIADKCEHSCCLGWEIDIDKDTMKKYTALKNEYGQIIRDNIATTPEPHFRLTCDERCPFLNEKNLCNIILNIGENYLCDICNDHPRYRNYDEIGLGLCCEEAARQLICETEPICIEDTDIEDDVDTEYEFPYHEDRNIVMSILNSEDSLTNKLRLINDEFDFDFTSMNIGLIANILRSLERLDTEWDKCIESFEDFSNKNPDSDFFTLTDNLSKEEQKMFSNIIIYFIHRYLPQSYSYESLLMFLRFAMVSTFVIGVIYTNEKRQVSTLIEICRLYSSEIEYSTENVEYMLEL